jgi:hypothetical protein
MKPYEQRELGRVGEGLRPAHGSDPLTQLQLSNKLPSLRNPLPMGEGESCPVNSRRANFLEFPTLTRLAAIDRFEQRACHHRGDNGHQHQHRE